MRRLANILLTGLVAVAVPMLLIGWLVGEFGAVAMLIGLLLGVVGSKIGGTRHMSYLAPAIGVAAALGAFTSYGWWWVALLAATGVLAGAGFGFGWFAPLLMIPYAAAFVAPLSSWSHALTYGAIAAIATGYGIVIARRFGVPAVVDGDRLGTPVVIVCGPGVWSRSRR